MVDLPTSRSRLRADLRRRRRELAPSAQAAAAAATAERLDNLARDAGWTAALAYLDHAGEIGTGPCRDTLERHGVTAVGLPRIDGEIMSFHRIGPSTALEPGPFAIPSPPASAPVVDPAQADVILVPLVGFDNQCNRLGMGGGYYDRLLHQYPLAVRIGLAHDLQRITRLRVEPWDQRLDLVITPTMTLTGLGRGVPDAPLEARSRP